MQVLLLEVHTHLVGDMVFRNNNAENGIVFGVTLNGYARVDANGVLSTNGTFTGNLDCACVKQEVYTYFTPGTSFQQIGRLAPCGSVKLNVATYYTSGSTYACNYSGVIQLVYGYNGGTNIETLSVTSYSGNVTIGTITQGSTSFPFQLLPFTGSFQFQITTAGTIFISFPTAFTMAKVRVQYDSGVTFKVLSR